MEKFCSRIWCLRTFDAHGLKDGSVLLTKHLHYMDRTGQLISCVAHGALAVGEAMHMEIYVYTICISGTSVGTHGTNL